MKRFNQFVFYTIVVMTIVPESLSRTQYDNNNNNDENFVKINLDHDLQLNNLNSSSSNNNDGNEEANQQMEEDNVYFVKAPPPPFHVKIIGIAIILIVVLVSVCTLFCLMCFCPHRFTTIERYIWVV